MRHYPRITRRQAVATLGAAAAATILKPLSGLAQTAVITKAIPSTGELIPAVGLGTWITFNVGDDPELREECAGVMKAFFDAGGRHDRFVPHVRLVAAGDRIWTQPLPRLRCACSPLTRCGRPRLQRGPEQVEDSRKHWGIQRFDLLQVHNLLAWEEHLPMLFAMKKAGPAAVCGYHHLGRTAP